MRERQGCRSASIQGDTGDMGERRFCRLRARRVVVCQHGSCTFRTRSASSLVTVDDCLLAGRLGVLSLPVWDSNTLPKGNDFK
jgi:hypothetical protein